MRNGTNLSVLFFAVCTTIAIAVLVHRIDDLHEDIAKLNAQLIELDRRRENDWCEYRNALDYTRDYSDGMFQACAQVCADAFSTADEAKRIAEQANERVMSKKMARRLKVKHGYRDS